MTKYTATVAVTTERAEIHVQEKHEKGVMAVYEEPEAGHYLMVVDATSLGKNKTQIEFYRPSMGFKPMPRSLMVSKIFNALLTSVEIWIKTTLFARYPQYFLKDIVSG